MLLLSLAIRSLMLMIGLEFNVWTLKRARYCVGRMHTHEYRIGPLLLCWEWDPSATPDDSRPHEGPCLPCEGEGEGDKELDAMDAKIVSFEKAKEERERMRMAEAIDHAINGIHGNNWC